LSEAVAGSSDPYGAFVPGSTRRIEGAPVGPLARTTFAVKDNIDVAGFVTGAGVPEWREGRLPADASAWAVRRLLEAGATFVGKTSLDELAYGALGQNEALGTPRNPRAPDCVPGGSSSGSAVAVAAGLADFALGSDTACSVRLPGALCGVFAFRPTMGRVDRDGLLPLAPSLDTLGWLARDADLLGRVGTELLAEGRSGEPLRHLALAEDAFQLAAPETRSVLKSLVALLEARFGGARRLTLGDERTPLTHFWYRAWRIEIREAWARYGGWIEAARPRSSILQPSTFREAIDSPPERDEEARAAFDALGEQIRSRVRPGTVVALPTVCAGAPRLDADPEQRRRFLHPTLCLMSIASVGGLPQVQIPAGALDGRPVGLSLVGPPGSDEELLGLARELAG
jgi:amidase